MEVINDYSMKKLGFFPTRKHLKAKRSVEHLLRERKTTNLYEKKNLMDKMFLRLSKIHVPS